jgi:hypothetical protein
MHTRKLVGSVLVLSLTTALTVVGCGVKRKSSGGGEPLTDQSGISQKQSEKPSDSEPAASSSSSSSTAAIAEVKQPEEVKEGCDPDAAGKPGETQDFVGAKGKIIKKDSYARNIRRQMEEIQSKSVVLNNSMKLSAYVANLHGCLVPVFKKNAPGTQEQVVRPEQTNASVRLLCLNAIQLSNLDLKGASPEVRARVADALHFSMTYKKRTGYSNECNATMTTSILEAIKNNDLSSDLSKVKQDYIKKYASKYPSGNSELQSEVISSLKLAD